MAKEDLLKEELETYREKNDIFVKESEGKCALIKCRDIVNIFESEKDAVSIEIEKFRNAPSRKLRRI